jgi:pimeloyl-ACP methyl ester carboxylesterase
VRRVQAARQLLGAVLAASSLVGPSLATAGAAGGSASVPVLGPLLLVPGDLPHGWSKVTTSKNNVTTHLNCLGALGHPPRGWRHQVATFKNGKGLPLVSEGLATGPKPAAFFRGVREEFSGCRSATLTINGKTDRAKISRFPFSSHATGAVASSWQLVATGLQLGLDVVLFRVHGVIGSVSYADAGGADALNAEAFANAAISKAGGGAGLVTGVVTVTTTPVRLVRTTAGTVAYRRMGSGPPLVLVMGYGGSMETWEPEFVNLLAHRFTVVLFDNAGIGGTSRPTGTLTIDGMAEQTSALIEALHLGSPDVLGWSMGGLIAQALAVLHPALVHRLVLCAAFPGTGAVRSPQAAVNDLNAGGQRALSVLFPPHQMVAATVFVAQTSFYLSSSAAPKKVVAAQASAIRQAWAGKDVALQRFTQIKVPTLVADGASDRLVPAANASELAAGIAGSKLKLYKGAGHAFLFQDLAAFVPAVESFLYGP